MQVTKDTFPCIFPEFVKLLNTCDFYAFDEEMTGINTNELPETITDSPEESYRAKRLVASRYNIIQVGVCLFHRVMTSSSPTRYVARPFNFILFPGHLDEFTTKDRLRDVVLSPSSLAFLRRHDMDFQSWIYEGISYCDASGEEMLRDKHKSKYEEVAMSLNVGNNSNEVDLMTDDQKKWFDNAVAAAKAFSQRIDISFDWAKERHAQCVSAVEVTARMNLLKTTGKEVFIPPQRSDLARKCLSVHLKKHFHNLSLTFRRQGESYSGLLKAVFPAELERQLIKDQTLKEHELISMLGFRLVFRALTESRKPCVGHNCCADVLFLLASFDAPLPETLSGFKQRISQLFPTILDTRYITSRQDFFPVGRFGSRYLGGFFDEYGLQSAHVHVTLPLGFKAYDPLSLVGRQKRSSGLVHEAGYDALLTGTLLLNLLAEMGEYNLDTVPPSVVNKLALFRSLYAVDLRNGLNEDEYLPRRGVIELRHEKHVKTHHIDSCFAALSLQDVVLYSVDETLTLAVLPWISDHQSLSASNNTEQDAGQLSTVITTRFPQYFEASVYRPPHLAGMTAVKGALHTTRHNLMRKLLRCVRR